MLISNEDRELAKKKILGWLLKTDKSISECMAILSDVEDEQLVAVVKANTGFNKIVNNIRKYFDGKDL